MVAGLTWLGIVTLMGIATTLAGRLVGTTFGIRLLRQPTWESFALAANAGTGFCILEFGACSYLGLPALRAAWVVGGTLLILLAIAGVRGRLRELLPPRLSQETIPLLAACVVAAGVALLPLIRWHSISALNDTFTYVCIADWLQENGFGTPCPQDPEQPAWSQVVTYQKHCFRMGAVFLLALVHAVLPSFLSLELFAPVMAWGMILNVLAVFLLCRWPLQTSRSTAAWAALAAAASAGPMCFAAQTGFLPQMYGTAALATSLAVLARFSAPGTWTRGGACLIGLTCATLFSVYSELTPVLGFAGLVFLAGAVKRAVAKKQIRRFLGFAGLTILAIAVIANVEVIRSVRSLAVMIGALAGEPLPWSAGMFWSFALGVRAYEASMGPAVTRIMALLTVCFLVGLWRAIKVRSALSLNAALLLLLGMAGYYFFFARDPHTGQIGHSWSVFKICKWAFPLVVAVQAAGFARLLGNLPFGKPLLAAAVAAAAFWLAPIHYGTAHARAAALVETMHSPRPFAAIREVRRALDQLGMERVYFVHEPAGIWPRCFVAYVMYPKRFLNTWADSCYLNYHYQRDQFITPGPGIAHVVWGMLPFDAPAQRLPGGLVVLDEHRPVVFQVGNFNGLEGGPDVKKWTWLGTEPANLYVWSPRGGRARLTFQSSPGPSRPENGSRRLRVTPPVGPDQELLVQPGEAVEQQFDLPAGISRIVVACLDVPTNQGPLANGDHRCLLLKLADPHVVLLDGATPEDRRLPLSGVAAR